MTEVTTKMQATRRDRVDSIVTAVIRSHGGAASPQTVESVLDAAGYHASDVRGAFDRLHLRTCQSPAGRVLWTFKT